jgi:hypothetical protein
MAFLVSSPQALFKASTSSYLCASVCHPHLPKSFVSAFVRPVLVVRCFLSARLVIAVRLTVARTVVSRVVPNNNAPPANVISKLKPGDKLIANANAPIGYGKRPKSCCRQQRK